MTEIVTMLNLAAQRKISASEVIDAYKNGNKRKRELFRESVICCFLQAKPTREEEDQARKSRDCNGFESLDHFETLLQLFCSADTRRRQTECENGCRHEWHNL